MSSPVQFLNALGQSLAALALYGDGHPARERAIDASYRSLRDLQRYDPRPHFSFLGHEVVYGRQPLRELEGWSHGTRLAHAGVQRLEFEADVSREEYERFLDEVSARLSSSAIDTAEQRQMHSAAIRYGALGIRGTEMLAGKQLVEEPLPTAKLSYSLVEEAAAVGWLHDELQSTGDLPLVEAEAIVRSLSVAMHGDSEMVLPLLELREFDEYTTTHSLNVSVLTMALCEHLGLSAADVRAHGVAGLLHDVGKVRIPKDILNKPGKLTNEERAVIRKHPADGARIILSSEQRLDLAAVVAYEHHIMLNGGGYPSLHDHRDCHRSSKLVHVCDVYDALRTKRPYRDAWDAERTLAYIAERAGTEFDPDAARAFIDMMRELEGSES